MGFRVGEEVYFFAILLKLSRFLILNQFEIANCMPSLYLSDLIRIINDDLNEVQAFQENHFERVQDWFETLSSPEIQKKIHFPNVSFHEISVSVPFYPSVLKYDLTLHDHRISINLPSLLISNSSGNLSRVTLTFTLKST